MKRTLTVFLTTLCLASCEKADPGYNWQSKPYTKGTGDSYSITSSPGS